MSKKFYEAIVFLPERSSEELAAIFAEMIAGEEDGEEDQEEGKEEKR